jgi:hypothetical protein
VDFLSALENILFERVDFKLIDRGRDFSSKKNGQPFAIRVDLLIDLFRL